MISASILSIFIIMRRIQRMDRQHKQKDVMRRSRMQGPTYQEATWKPLNNFWKSELNRYLRARKSRMKHTKMMNILSFYDGFYRLFLFRRTRHFHIPSLVFLQFRHGIQNLSMHFWDCIILRTMRLYHDS